MKLQDLSVVLTGATNSVGAALARALVARGARVLLVARSAAPLAELARELTRDDDHRHRVDALASDVTNPGALLGIRDAAIARGANVLINAANADDGEALQALDAVHIDAILQSNLVAPVQLTRALLPHLLRQPSARVLNIGLPLGVTGNAGGAVHCASQLGLRGFCDALRPSLPGPACASSSWQRAYPTRERRPTLRKRRCACLSTETASHCSESPANCSRAWRSACARARGRADARRATPAEGRHGAARHKDPVRR